VEDGSVPNKQLSTGKETVPPPPSPTPAVAAISSPSKATPNVEEPEKSKKRKEASKERKDYRKTVEKKRRAKITNAIDEFRDIIPTTGVDKIKKALVLELAVNYIKHLKAEYESLSTKNRTLMQRNGNLRAEQQTLDQNPDSPETTTSTSNPSTPPTTDLDSGSSTSTSTLTPTQTSNPTSTSTSTSISTSTETG